ncbi:hypothetical protein ASG98_17510 [Bacillus sp. Soil531]|nr:hypothetical protein ASG98_17510 [Bacillus sp. Soil531]
MNKLLTLTIASEVFLLLPFLIIFFINRKTKKNILLPFLIIGGAPLLYLVIDDLNSNYLDANIGLGLSFMFTWMYSLIALIIAIILLVRKRRKNNI